MDIYQQDESTDISQNRMKYSSDNKFLKILKNLMSDVEFNTANNPELSIEKLIEISNMFRELGDLRYSL